MQLVNVYPHGIINSVNIALCSKAPVKYHANAPKSARKYHTVLKTVNIALMLRGWVRVVSEKPRIFQGGYQQGRFARNNIQRVKKLASWHSTYCY